MNEITTAATENLYWIKNKAHNGFIFSCLFWALFIILCGICVPLGIFGFHTFNLNLHIKLLNLNPYTKFNIFTYSSFVSGWKNIYIFGIPGGIGELKYAWNLSGLAIVLGNIFLYTFIIGLPTLITFYVLMLISGILVTCRIKNVSGYLYHLSFASIFAGMFLDNMLRIEIDEFVRENTNYQLEYAINQNKLVNTDSETNINNSDNWELNPNCLNLNVDSHLNN